MKILKTTQITHQLTTFLAAALIAVGSAGCGGKNDAAAPAAAAKAEAAAKEKAAADKKAADDKAAADKKAADDKAAADKKAADDKAAAAAAADKKALDDKAAAAAAADKKAADDKAAADKRAALAKAIAENPAASNLLLRVMNEEGLTTKEAILAYCIKKGGSTPGGAELEAAKLGLDLDDLK